MENLRTNSDLKHYFKEIKSLFPIYGEKEKKFVADLKTDIDEYISTNPSCSHGELLMTFGEPKIIVSQYIADADSEYLSKRLRTSRLIRLAIIAVVIITVAIAISIEIKAIQLSIEAQQHFIDREVITTVDYGDT